MSLTKEISDELTKRGFCVWRTHENTVSCFDILARRDAQIFVIKFYKFIEGITKENAEEMKNLAVCLSAYLIVLAEASKNCPLNEDVLYSRYDIAVVTYETFKKILDEEYPLLYSTRGNYCAEIDREIFSEIKSALNLTLDDISKILNVSKQAVYSSLGFLTWEGTAAFNILAINRNENKTGTFNSTKEDKNFIIVSNDLRVLTRRADFVEEIMEIIPGICVCIGKYKPGKTLGKRAKFIKENDLRGIETKEEFIEIVKG
ncbi:MAG: hypothetical protein CVT88_08685 [Candidatus Altiarchaeales archaeon HGW-Altiarchaeales-1]|nr:MAG: hypothetical protein CVT88_08685 [Candidatus Altiarchaeales archaeon HGW-Altiarchaeales-1]